MEEIANDSGVMIFHSIYITNYSNFFYINYKTNSAVEILLSLFLYEFPKIKSNVFLKLACLILTRVQIQRNIFNFILQINKTRATFQNLIII